MELTQRLGLVAYSLVAYSLLASPVSASCLTDLAALPLDPTQVKISWTYSCSLEKLEQVKVHYQHDGYLACSGGGGKDTSRGPGFGYTKIFLNNYTDMVTVNGLHPFSRYVFEVRDIRVDVREVDVQYLDARTGQGPPQAEALPRSLLSSPPSPSSLHWDWGPPAPSTCSQWGARPDHYHWTLRPLRGGSLQEGQLPLSQTSLKVPGLQPATSYQLEVFLANSAGDWDERRGLRLLPQTTLPSEQEGQVQEKEIGQEKEVSQPSVLLISLACVGVLLLLLLLLCFLVTVKKRCRRKELKGQYNQLPLLHQQADVLSKPMSVSRGPEPQYEEVDYTVVPLAPHASKETLASRESLDEDGYLKNNDHRVLHNPKNSDHGVHDR